MSGYTKEEVDRLIDDLQAKNKKAMDDAMNGGRKEKETEVREYIMFGLVIVAAMTLCMVIAGHKK